MEDWLASTAYIVGLYTMVLLVHILCPARVVQGYVCHVQSKEPLVYHLNGFLCLWIVPLGFCLLPLDMRIFLPRHYLQCAVVSNGVGLLASLWFVYVRYGGLTHAEQKANRLRRAPTLGGNMPQDLDDRRPFFYWGREFNPRFALPGSFVLDVKMFLYTVGAVVLGLNILGAVFYEQTLRADGGNSKAILLYAGIFSWFLLDYVWYEEVHLLTYDIFAEKIGFKLVWSCLCFYPFFYPIGILPFVMATDVAAPTPPDLSNPAMIAIGLLYMVGSILTRGANLQKYYFRQHPDQPTVSLWCGILQLKQGTVPSSRHRLLCSGFWGLSRHVNYFGEIVQGTALALPAFLYLTDGVWRWVPWLYPLFYVALFVPRQIDDDALMRQKYGDKIMDEYIKLVPWRIVPGVY